MNMSSLGPGVYAGNQIMLLVERKNTTKNQTVYIFTTRVSYGILRACKYAVN